MNIGYYCLGSNKVLACPEGTYNNNTGASNVLSCNSCASGKYSFNGSSTCYTCPANNYIKNAASGCSTTCNHGSVLNAAKTSCTKCPAGTTNVDPNTPCAPCPAGNRTLNLLSKQSFNKIN